MLRIKLPEWETEAILIQEISELPSWFDNTYLYLDLETTSGIDKIASTNPWMNCKILGISILVDEEVCPLYIPLRHRGENVYHNLPYEPVITWLQKVINTSKVWVNHNIKYDAHVLKNEGLEFDIKFIDTLVLCKLLPKEERFTYNLTDIMREWFYVNIEPYEQSIKANLYRGEKDYGLIPIDIMAPYAAVDTLCVREIKKQADALIDPECSRIVELETSLTQHLFNIENKGLKLDVSKVIFDYELLQKEMELIQQKLVEVTGIRGFRAHTNGDCYKFFIERLKLPVLEYTDKKNPSFGDLALQAYRIHAPEFSSVINLIEMYKKRYKLWTSFTCPYIELSIDGKIHPDFNQIVRTGRMSCRNPNMQQLSLEAKKYIIPLDKSSKLVEIDFSQIEFRLIAHFIRSEPIIREFTLNPNADYHQLVADLCRIDRKPAKNINFMLGFGGGREKCIAMLMSIASIISELKDKAAIEARATEVYERYHKMLPTLKPTSYKAMQIVRQRRYVRTLLGRRRYLHPMNHKNAFNTVIQGSAADLFKSAMLRVCENIKGCDDIQLLAVVHDSFLFNVRGDAHKRISEITNLIEEIPEGVNLRVPIRASVKTATTNWSECQ